MAAQMVTANSLNSRPRIPPMNNTGMNTAASDRVMETIVNPISREPRNEASKRGLAPLHVTHDVLEHHDSVVHHESDTQDQRHHGEIIQA